MTEQVNRVDWLERQLAQVKGFIAAESTRLLLEPDKFSIKLSLGSWKTHQEELFQELRQARAALQHEVIELRLIGRRMDGSIPLKLLSRVSDKLSAILAHAAYHLRHGQGPRRGGLDPILTEMDLRFSDMRFGSTRLVLAGNIEPDLTGDSAMGGALEQIFSVLQSSDPEMTRELVASVGIPATKALSELLGLLGREEIGAELTWPAPNAKLYRWGGSIDMVREAHDKLSPLEKIKPVEVSIEGVVAQLRDSGAIYVRVSDKQIIKISYNSQQFTSVQPLQMGVPVKLRAMLYVNRDPLTEREYPTYRLITSD